MNLKNKIIFTLLLFVLVFQFKTYSQSPKDMLMYQIENKQFKKTNNNTYTISGEIDIKINVAGVNISNISYKSEEILNTSKGIVFQKFVENSDSYFTIQLINE